MYHSSHFHLWLQEGDIKLYQNAENAEALIKSVKDKDMLMGCMKEMHLGVLLGLTS